MNELHKIETLDRQPFKNMIATIGNLPTSFVDSMSYYECIAWLVNYIEHTLIPAVNGNAEALVELQAQFVELKAYVDNYFENLDVQEEINNKLDDMAESGQLQEIISTYLNSNAVFGFSTVADMKEATNLMDGSYARTTGYASESDGGGALYKIKEATGSEVIDEGSIIAMDDETIVAYLVTEDYVTPEMFGAIGDGATDDTTAFENAIKTNLKIVGSDNKTYKLDHIITSADIDIENCVFFSDSVESATDMKYLFRTTSDNVQFKNCTFISESDQLPVINQINGRNEGLASNVVAIRADAGCKVLNCKFDNIYGLETRGATTIDNCEFNEVEMGVFAYTDKFVKVTNTKFYMNRLVDSWYYHAMYIPSANNFFADNIVLKEVNSGQCGDHFHFRTSDGTGSLTTPNAVISNVTIDGDLTYPYISQINNANVYIDNMYYRGTTNGAFITGHLGNLNISNSQISCAGETLFKCYNNVVANNCVFTCSANTVQLLSRCNLDMRGCTINAVGTLNFSPDAGNMVYNLLDCVFTANTINSLNIGGNTNVNNILGCVYNITTGTLNLLGIGYIEAIVRDGAYPTALTTVGDKNCWKLAVEQSNHYFKKLESIVTE